MKLRIQLLLHIFRLIVGVVVTLSISLTADLSLAADESSELNKLKSAYTTNIELLARPLADLDANYETALDRLAEEATAKGNLDAVLAIKDERTNYRNGATKKIAKSAELAKTRKLYEQSRNQRLGELSGRLNEHTASYISQLNALVVSLTKANNVESAVAAREESARIQKLLNDPEKLAANLLGVRPQGAAPTATSSGTASAPGPLIPLAARVSGTLEMMGQGSGSRLAELHIDQRTDIIDVTLAWNRWHAIKKDGSVITGTYNPGFNAPAGIPPALRLRVCGNATTAFHQDGTATSWGLFDSAPGAQPPADLGPVRDLACTSQHGLAALADGSLRVWGNLYATEDAAKKIESGMRDIVLVAATDDSAWAITSTGTLSRWTKKQATPKGLGRYSQPVQLTATNSGFSLLKADGTVNSWNNWAGGIADLTPSNLKKVKQIGANWSCFVVQQEDGSWMTYGGKFTEFHDKIGSLGPLIDADISSWSSNGLAGWVK